MHLTKFHYIKNVRVFLAIMTTAVTINRLKAIVTTFGSISQWEKYKKIHAHFKQCRSEMDIL